MQEILSDRQPSEAISVSQETNGAGRYFEIVVLHEDHVVRTGLSTMLAARPEVLSVTLAADADELVGKVFECRPHVAMLPAKAVCESADQLREVLQRCGTKVLLLLRASDRIAAVRSSRVTVSGFLVESTVTEQSLSNALQSLHRGEMSMPSDVMWELLADGGGGGSDHGERLHQLTPREQETLVLLTEGLSNKQIARRLGISEHGTKRHVANVLAKLNCPNRTLAAALAVRDGLVPPS